VSDVSRCQKQEVLAEQWVSEILRSVQEYRAHAQEELRAMFGTRYSIDEVALMFTSPSWALRFIGSAVRVPGITMFNAAHDVVTTRPIVSTYSAHYWFLTTPDEEDPWRLECMYAHVGSPLHDSYRGFMADRDVIAVHASFKCADEEAYGVAVKTLRDNGYEAAQLCDSTYGRFSYWMPEEEGATSGLYLKPRVNLRDMDVEIGDDDE